jgi:Tol biopolymer transport system component
LIGQTISHFRIASKLGEGGMGEVYRAVDSRLGREVAIKVLPEAFTRDPERLARFEREARVLASLNHPNIAGIHQVEEADGLLLLVMELVEGEDLATRLERGPIALDDTLRIAGQVAEALESAHERGIVHRDLKPANVKITPDGQAKVLDFGLAKALEGPAEGSGSTLLSVSPTLTAGMTRAGVLLGTAAYMSPEQAKGLAADRRADIWAFAVVVWEMLTGRRLFAGDSVSDTLAAVLRDDIDGSTLPDDTPPALLALLARCLDRNPRSRLRDIGEARVALAALAGGDDSTLVGSSVVLSRTDVAPGRGSRLPWILAAALGALALLFAALALRPRQEPAPLVTSSLAAPDGTQFDVGNGLALSPDGKRLAFSALDQSGQRALWVRSIETGEARRLNGTEGAIYPFWSPESRSLAFMMPGALKRIPADGGAAQTLATVREGRGGAWGPDGTIVYAPDFRSGLWRIASTGGEPERLTEPDLDQREQAHRFPVFLPGGDRVLFLVQTAEGGSQVDDSRIEVLDLASGERRPIVTVNSSMAWAPSGHLLFWREGSLMVAGLEPRTATLTSDPVAIAEGIGYTGNEFATFSVSGTGLLVYQAGSLYESYTGMVEVDAAGREIGKGTETDYHQAMRLSHDGSRVAYTGADNSTIWIRELARQTKTRFTFADGDHFEPVWSPDDRWIAFITSRSGHFQIFRKAASGLGEEELLFESEQFVLNLYDWSLDGRYLSLGVLDPASDTDRDIALLDLETGELELVVQTPFFEANARFSPDGRWLAYWSAESGQFEVYVIPLAERGGKLQISTTGGGHPQWDPTGTRLYYINQLVALMEVGLDLADGVDIGFPRELFRIRHQWNQDPPFQVMPDGESFLTIQLEQEIRGGDLTLVQNWPERLTDRD